MTIQEQFIQALHLHKQGQLKQAEKLYLQALAQEPHHVQTLQYLGLLHGQTRRYESALNYLQLALKLAPDVAEMLHHLGEVYLMAGQFEAAENSFQQALAQNQTSFDSHYKLGKLYLKQKHPQKALDCFERAFEINPQHPELLLKLAQIRAKDQPQLALELLQTLQKLQPNSASVSYLQAEIYLQLQNKAMGLQYLEQALLLNPQHLPSLRRLAKLWGEQGKFAEAIELLQRGLKIAPSEVQFWLDWSELAFYQGQHAKALAILTEGLKTLNHSVALHFQLGTLLRKFKKIPLAMRQFEKVLDLEPSHIDALHQLAMINELQGNIEAARGYYQKLIQLKPDSHLLTLHYELLSPSVLAHSEAIQPWEEQISQVLDKWLRHDFRWDFSELKFFTGYTNFIYIYQTRGNGRYLREKIVALFRPYFSQMRPLKGACPRPKIGFLVTKGHESVFIKSMAGIFNHLSREKFEWVIFCDPLAFQKTILPRLTPKDIQMIPLPQELQAAAETVHQARCAILNFWEIASDNQNFFLPFYKLAPIQTLSWGCPMTSGNSAVDYYLSSVHLENPQAQDNYTEKLHLFSVLPTYYFHPTLPARFKSRVELGFAEQTNLYLVSQNIYKIHPDFDALVYAILQRDPQGEFVFLESKLPHLNLELKKRLFSVCLGVEERIKFLAKLPFEEYLDLVYISTLVMDPPHYVGANTSYDAFAVGTPVITYPTSFHRGRHTYAAYQEMGIQDAIAWSESEYIDKAVYYATDKEARAELSQRILKQKSILFENMQIVREYEAFFEQVLTSD